MKRCLPITVLPSIQWSQRWWSSAMDTQEHLSMMLGRRRGKVLRSFSSLSSSFTFFLDRLLQYKLTKWPMGRQDAVSASFSSTGCQLYVMHRTLPPCLFDLWDEEVKLSFMDDTGCYKNMATMKSGCFMGQNDEVRTLSFLSLSPSLSSPLSLPLSPSLPPN